MLASELRKQRVERLHWLYQLRIQYNASAGLLALTGLA